MHVRSPTVLFWVAGLALVLLVVVLRYAGVQGRAEIPSSQPSDDSTSETSR
jgi:hypothetical protein